MNEHLLTRFTMPRDAQSVTPKLICFAAITSFLSLSIGISSVFASPDGGNSSAVHVFPGAVPISGKATAAEPASEPAASEQPAQATSSQDASTTATASLADESSDTEKTLEELEAQAAAKQQASEQNAYQHYEQATKYFSA